MDEDIKYPSNSLYYSAPSKMIETHVNKPKEYKKIGYEEEKDHYYLQTSYDGPPMMKENEEASKLNEIRRARDELKILRGKTARNRDKRISDTLKQVHKPWHSRPTKDTIQDT